MEFQLDDNTSGKISVWIGTTSKGFEEFNDDHYGNATFTEVEPGRTCNFHGALDFIRNALRNAAGPSRRE